MKIKTTHENCRGMILVVIILSIIVKTEGLPCDNQELNICLTKQCIRTSATFLENMDTGVNPCENFYQFACGNFIKNGVVPDEKSKLSKFDDSDQIEKKLKRVVQIPIHEHDSKTLKLLKSWYGSCMNDTQIEEEGLSFVKKLIKNLGGWPVIETNWSEISFEWVNLLHDLQKSGWQTNALFFKIFVDTDTSNSSKRILSIDQPEIESDIMKKGLNNTRVLATYNLLTNLTKLLSGDQHQASNDLLQVIDFESKLSEIIVPLEELNVNLTLTYNPMTVENLQRKIPSIPWLKIINNFLSPIDEFTSNDIVNVKVPKFLKELADLLAKTEKKVLANYMFSNLLLSSNFVIYLPEAFRNKELEYEKTVSGQEEMLPRWQVCLQDLYSQPIAVSWLFVKAIVNKNIKNKAIEMVEDIKNSFIDTLKTIDWMDEKTRTNALIKAKKTISFVAYPDQVVNDSIIDEYYKELQLKRDEYILKLILTRNIFTHLKEVTLLRKPVIRTSWRHFNVNFDVNAEQIPSLNAIRIPAALLESSFYHPDRPQYINYGEVGTVIGHEMTHGFDDTGSQYDQDGNVIDWWEKETGASFKKKSQCLVRQYGNYSTPDKKMNVNGNKTLSENIADNGANKIAYYGYLKWIERNGEELPLPGLPYTPRQMFWIAAANNWCTKYKSEALEQDILTDFHAPDFVRGLIPMINSEDFSRDFDCPLGSPMNPTHKCQVW